MAPAALGAGARAVSAMSWGWALLKDPLVNGLLGGLIGGLASGFAGGWLAGRGTIKAAKLQIAEAREARRIAEAARKDKAAREAATKRDRLREAVRTEGVRIARAAAALMQALPSAQGWANRQKEHLVIASSPLLRGEPREDIALLRGKTRALLQKVASVLDAYNTRITAAPAGSEGPLIETKVLDLIRELRERAAELQED
jgi:hypothetical protein